MEPWETVQLEHRDRTDRLIRLSQGIVGLEFFQSEISPAEHGLSDFPASLPVLRVVAHQDLFFDSGSDVIRPEAYKFLDLIAQSLKLEPPDVTLFVAGHTDADGTEEDNAELGLRRAQRVAASLVTRSIYQASIYRVSFGEYLPLDGNDTEVGKARNRRVEFLFAARAQAIVAMIKKLPLAPCEEDQVGGCRRALNLEAVEVALPVDQTSKIEKLMADYERLSLDSTLSPIQLEQQRQQIEEIREQVPLDLTQSRIPIDLSGQ